MAQPPFRFETLLERATRREEQEALDLAAATREEEAVRVAIADLEREREQIWAEFAWRNAPFHADSYASAVAYVQRLTERIEDQEAELIQAKGRVASAHDALMATRKEKQSLERLRDRQAAEAAAEETRREAIKQDDLNMSRHARRPNGPGNPGKSGAA